MTEETKTLKDALKLMVRVFNKKEIDPLEAFVAIERAKHAIGETPPPSRPI